MTARVLWVAAEPPHRQAWGGPIRQAHLLQALAEHTHVDLLLAGGLEDAGVRQACRSVAEVAVPPAARVSPTRRRLQALRPGPPQEVRASAGARRALSAHWPDEHHDVVVLVHNETAPLQGRVGVGSRTIVDLHHLLSVRHSHAARRATGRARLWHGLEAARARRFERRLRDAVDRVVVCSEQDATALGGGVVVGNGVDLDRWRPTPLPAQPNVVFTGHLAYPANVDAVQWLAGDVVPLLRQRVPHVRVSVVGRAPTAELRAVAAAAGIDVAADVEDIRVHLDAARVAVVPIRIGSGTRLKALEAMAAGRPVVGTSIGLEGLGLRDGVDALVADTATAMAAHVAALLTDDAHARRIAAAGRCRAEAFAWDAVGQRFVEAVLA